VQQLRTGTYDDHAVGLPRKTHQYMRHAIAIVLTQLLLGLQQQQHNW
jgi:hypothetical protein